MGQSTMTAEAFRAETGVSRETLARLQAYAALLEKWNRAINLVGRKTLPDLWRRHMLDSAQLMDHLPGAPTDRPRVVADLGSGAGFPGLVLAILGAGEVHLIESDQRKAAFLREAARVTETDVTIHAARIEAVQGLAADVVTARALAALPELIEMARPILAPAGVCLFLKGRDADRELTAVGKDSRIVAETFRSRSDSAGTIIRLEVSGHHG